MKIKKYIAVILSATMLLSLAGCSNKAKKYEKVFEDLGYEEMEEFDEDDFEDDIEDGIFYTTKDEKELKKLCKFCPIENAKAKNVSSISIGGREDDDGYYSVFTVTFKSKADAEKAFEKSVDALDESYEDYKEWADKKELGQDDGDDFYSMAYVGSYSGSFSDIFMVDSKTITYIDGYFSYSEDVYDDYVAFYEAIERDCPTDLVKNEVRSKKSHDKEIEGVAAEIEKYS
ncbi:MAG: hypothetical protein MJ108_01055 [Saccharofermentans sp.]|nr:hypothetical protein [Saccharofermentans sp.]